MATKIVDTLLPTTMVGSYPRPHWFKQQLLGRDIRVAFKEVQHEEAYHDAVATVIRDQEEAGLDIVTDGNMWYDDYVGVIGSFCWYMYERIGGFDPAFGKGRRIGSAEDLDLMYRALRRGLSIRYLPHVVVHHAHGRDSEVAVAEVKREYVRGRGAFYWKFITDREIARMAYWEIAGLLARRRRGTEAWRTLCTLAAGAACQSWFLLRGAAPR